MSEKGSAWKERWRRRWLATRSDIDLLYYESREQDIVDRCRAVRNLADELEAEGGHTGTVAHYRSLADGLAEAHRILREGEIRRLRAEHNQESKEE